MTYGAAIAGGFYGLILVWCLHHIIAIAREKRAEDRLMRWVLAQADDEWAEDEDWGVFADCHDEIAHLPVANPWSVAE